MPAIGDVLSHAEMCQVEGTMLQQGMRFRLNSRYSVLLMSRRENAPYPDRLSDDGRTLYYIGHDAYGQADKERIDQPLVTPKGTPTQNGHFFDAAMRASNGHEPETVRVYEKIMPGAWVYNGTFALRGARIEPDSVRHVCVFELHLIDGHDHAETGSPELSSPGRLIPGEVKRIVWKRDEGKCTQ